MQAKKPNSKKLKSRHHKGRPHPWIVVKIYRPEKSGEKLAKSLVAALICLEVSRRIALRVTDLANLAQMLIEWLSGAGIAF